jgi:glutamate--cysteine ligase
LLDRNRLIENVRALFVSSDAAEGTIGAELELIPFDSETRRLLPIVSADGKSSLPIIRSIARRARWVEIPAEGDPPSWSLPDGGRVSFEPGGQIELSSAAAASASELIRDLQCASQLLTSAFESAEILLETPGVDPYNGIETVELQLHRPRYERMTRYFNSIGPSGVRMMRQTASLQINVQSGENPAERWALLNAMTPYITAIFANSPIYEGESTGHSSYRAHLWRTLDTTRTGLPVATDDPADAYLDFALNAGPMMAPPNEEYRSFAEWMKSGDPTSEDWDLHLTTLFPEVRPRGYLEVRSADAVAPEDLAAPIAFVTGLTYDDAAARNAAELIGASDGDLLARAGRAGLGDPQIRTTAIALIDLALAGCESLGGAYLGPADQQAAADFFDRYTRQGRSPGDERS